MILYKYLDQQKGEQFLQNPLLNFTPPKFFNDPFEATASYPVFTDVDTILKRKKFTDEIYRSHYNILSLTRSPLNKLMWSHYTKDHRGYVIGIDMNQNVFTNLNTCTIPVQFGSVIYTETKPNAFILSESSDSAYRYDFPNYTLKNSEFLQRLFLYKSLDWAYEEEVRIVKMLGNIGLHPGEDNERYLEEKEQFITKTKNGMKRSFLKIPEESVKEIYFGVNVNINYFRDKIRILKNNFESIKIFKCEIDEFTWKLKAFEHNV